MWWVVVQAMWGSIMGWVRVEVWGVVVIVCRELVEVWVYPLVVDMV